jgi:hypothetical protein
MRRKCAVALAAGLAALAYAPKILGRHTSSFAVTEPGVRNSDEFAVPLLEAISQEREAGTTGVPLLSLVNVCPRWPFCHDAKVLVYALHNDKVIFYWYRKDQPCSLEYHPSGPCENGESKGFEILARIIEDRKGALQVKNGRLVWGDKYVYAFSLQGLQLHNFAFTGRIYFQRASCTREYFSQPVSVSQSAITATGPERPEDGILPGIGGVQSMPPRSVPYLVWLLCVGFVVVVLATIRRRSTVHRKGRDDESHETNSFLNSSLSNVSVADMSDEAIPAQAKEIPGTAWCPETILKRALLDSAQGDDFEKDDHTSPVGSLESTCVGSSGGSSSLSSLMNESMNTYAGTYEPVYPIRQ